MKYQHVTTEKIMDFIAERIEELKRRRERFTGGDIPTAMASERISELVHLRHTMQTREQKKQRENPANTAVREKPSMDKIVHMYRDAIQVQDACNLSGVLFSFAQHMQTLCDMGLDTDQKNQHPVSILFSSKIGSLTGSELLSNYPEAMDHAKKFMADVDGIKE